MTRKSRDYINEFIYEYYLIHTGTIEDKMSSRMSLKKHEDLDEMRKLKHSSYGQNPCINAKKVKNVYISYKNGTNAKLHYQI